jgi:LytS/YehU family sensor histidine kinase
MKNYIDLERERCSEKIEVSWNVEGNTQDRFISPLLMLPFLENAFKHGIAPDIERSWLSVDVSVRGDVLRCKIANSKSETVRHSGSDCGKDIGNVKRRLALMYPDSYELKTHDEGNFYVVSLLIRLSGFRQVSTLSPLPYDGHQMLVV